MEHLNGIFARVGRNLNNNFQKRQMPAGGGGGGGGGLGMLKLPSERYIVFDKYSVARTIPCAWLCCFSL